MDKILHPADAKEATDEAQDGAEATKAESYETGLAGGDTRFQVFARVYSLSTHLGVTFKADVAPHHRRCQLDQLLPRCPLA